MHNLTVNKKYFSICCPFLFKGKYVAVMYLGYNMLERIKLSLGPVPLASQKMETFQEEDQVKEPLMITQSRTWDTKATW